MGNRSSSCCVSNTATPDLSRHNRTNASRLSVDIDNDVATHGNWLGCTNTNHSTHNQRFNTTTSLSASDNTSQTHTDSQLAPSSERKLKHRQNASTTTAHLQHISEREPDDLEDDPSLHPSVGPLFVGKTAGQRPDLAHNGLSHRRSRYNLISADRKCMVKSSSCSTIFLDDSTVSQPNLKTSIKCLALATYYHIKNRSADRTIDIFNEQRHPLTRESVYTVSGVVSPEHKHIYKFVRTLFIAAQLTAECAIITLVYLERLLTYGDIDITPLTWRRVMLGAILLASKVWDDQAVWNIDYCQILKDMSVEDMNALERQFLEVIQFNINVPASVYAKYYFNLRTLAEHSGLSVPTAARPLSNERARRLEAMSRVCDFHTISSITDTSHSTAESAIVEAASARGLRLRRRCNSADRVMADEMSRFSRAVLS